MQTERLPNGFVTRLVNNMNEHVGDKMFTKTSSFIRWQCSRVRKGDRGIAIHSVTLKTMSEYHIK